MIETQLERSGTVPLAVSFNARHNDIAGKSVDMLIKESWRWESLHLRASGTPVPRLCNRLQRVEGLLPTLRYLEWIDFPEYFVGVVMSTAPRLCAVVLTPDDHSTCSASPGTHFPWTQITKFRGSYCCLQDCAAIFKAAPNLVGCEMSLHSPAASHSSDGPNLVLPRLLRLDVSGYVLSCISDAPLLQDLWVSCTATATRALTSFVLRSSCHLRKLVIHKRANSRALVAALRVVPTLTAFFVVFSRRASGFMDDEEHLLDALKMIVAGAEICPNLTHITAGGHLGFAVASFLDMVQPPPFDAVARIAGVEGRGSGRGAAFRGAAVSGGMGRP
ncbi:hypothetical protein B0H14DRAFT_3638982 [Mycena olivaceomarginata]|nr:hypothetical protein B0H14DRAFT_3638982 [Mycena olivaceomarginata]